MTLFLISNKERRFFYLQKEENMSEVKLRLLSELFYERNAAD